MTRNEVVLLRYFGVVIPRSVEFCSGLCLFAKKGEGRQVGGGVCIRFVLFIIHGRAAFGGRRGFGDVQCRRGAAYSLGSVQSRRAVGREAGPLLYRAQRF